MLCHFRNLNPQLSVALVAAAPALVPVSLYLRRETVVHVEILEHRLDRHREFAKIILDALLPSHHRVVRGNCHAEYHSSQLTFLSRPNSASANKSAEGRADPPALYLQVHFLAIRTQLDSSEPEPQQQRNRSCCNLSQVDLLRFSDSPPSILHEASNTTRSLGITA